MSIMTGTFLFGFKRILVALFAFFAFCSAALAQESLITSVAISKPKELNGAYKLTINADKPVEYKAKAENSDSIYFDLKNALAVDNLDTIYDNVSGIDALIVQQLENSKVRIYVNGVNTSSTQIAFKTSQQTGSNATNEVVINRPIREYRPTNDINEIAGEDIDWDENSFNPGHLASSFFGIFDGRSDLTFVICFILLVLCAVATKKVFARVKVQEEPLIGLTSAYQKNDEPKNPQQLLDSVYKNAPAPKRPLNASKAVQRPDSRYAAHTYQRMQPQMRAAQKNIQKNLINQNYALGAYQNAQKNPYMQTEKVSQPVAYQKRAVQNPSRRFVSKPVQNEIPAPKKPAASVESIKFLESVTKIYEQSGRQDLAQGLRAGINKRKTAV